MRDLSFYTLSEAELLEKLGHEDVQVREDAVEGLFHVGDIAAFETLYATLADDWQVGYWAALALNRIDPTRAVDLLMNDIQSQNISTRRCAAAYLGYFRDPRAGELLLIGCDDPDPVLRYNALDSLCRSDKDRAVAPAFRALKDEDARVRELAVNLLYIHRIKNAVASIAERLTDSNVSVRRAAAYIVGSLRGSVAFDRLIICLQDEDARVRENAVRALSMLRDPRALQPVSELLNDPEEAVRRQVASSLDGLGGDRMTESLIVLLDDSDLSVRENALRSLEALMVAGTVKARRKRRVLEALVHTLADPTLRYDAAEILLGVEQRRVLRLLEPYLRHEDPLLRAGVLDALVMMRTSDQEVLHSYSLHIFEESLIACLRDEAVEVRRHAATALGYVPERTSVVQALIAAQSDLDAGVREQATLSLEEMGQR